MVFLLCSPNPLVSLWKCKISINKLSIYLGELYPQLYDGPQTASELLIGHHSYWVTTINRSPLLSKSVNFGKMFMLLLLPGRMLAGTMMITRSIMRLASGTSRRCTLRLVTMATIIFCSILFAGLRMFRLSKNRKIRCSVMNS